MRPPTQRVQIARDDSVRSPHKIWNAFVDWLREVPLDELTPLQRDACLVFRYDAEIQAGGHERFLRGHDPRRVDETTRALGRLDASKQQAVLRRAAAAWSAGEADEARLHDFDREYHACSPEIHELLERCLEQHTSEFVEWC